jgi:hypothetical protein
MGYGHHGFNFQHWRHDSIIRQKKFGVTLCCSIVPESYNTGTLDFKAVVNSGRAVFM